MRPLEQNRGLATSRSTRTHPQATEATSAGRFEAGNDARGGIFSFLAHIVFGQTASTGADMSDVTLSLLEPARQKWNDATAALIDKAPWLRVTIEKLAQSLSIGTQIINYERGAIFLNALLQEMLANSGSASFTLQYFARKEENNEVSFHKTFDILISSEKNIENVSKEFIKRLRLIDQNVKHLESNGLSELVSIYLDNPGRDTLLLNHCLISPRVLDDKMLTFLKLCQTSGLLKVLIANKTVISFLRNLLFERTDDSSFSSEINRLNKMEYIENIMEQLSLPANAYVRFNVLEIVSKNLRHKYFTSILHKILTILSNKEYAIEKKNSELLKLIIQ